MSWGMEYTGLPSGVKQAVAEYMDKTAATYAGKPEGDDILACKERLLKLIDATAFLPEYGMPCNGVTVKASGSHSWNESGITSASFTVQLTRVSLRL